LGETTLVNNTIKVRDKPNIGILALLSVKKGYEGDLKTTLDSEESAKKKLSFISSGAYSPPDQS